MIQNKINVNKQIIIYKLKIDVKKLINKTWYKYTNDEI